MNAIKATVKGGRLELQVPPDWPDGTEVLVQPVDDDYFGMREEDWPSTPEATTPLGTDQLAGVYVAAEAPEDLTVRPRTALANG